MTILLQHARKHYVNKDCDRGFCEDRSFATQFKSIFSAMKYLCSQGEKSINEYNFIEDKKGNKDEQAEINPNRLRRRFI